jgi:renalase
VLEAQVKKWRFATPTAIWPEPCWTAPDAPLVLAGDAFAGPKVEGAFNSGLAAAAAIRSFA